MDKNLRIDWLMQSFSHHSNIKIFYMDETGLEAFPQDMKAWAERFKKIVGNDVNVKFADETYRELNEKYFPECQFIAFDRTLINISATDIRWNPEKYFDFIAEPAQEFFKEIIKKGEWKDEKNFSYCWYG